LLVEENRVQLLTNAQTGVNQSNSAVSTDLPALLSGADVTKITWPNTSGNGPNFVNISVSSSFQYTASWYVWIPSAYDATRDGPPELDIDIGTTGSGGSKTTGFADLTKRNQWQRVVSVLTNGTGASATCNIVMRRPVVSGVGGQVCYVTCPQFELGAFPTSYLPSTAGAVSRLVENVTMSVGPWWVTQIGTQVVEAYMSQLNSSPKELMGVGGTPGKTSINIQGGNNIAMFDTGGVNTAIALQPTGSIFKVGYSYQNGTQRGAMNGGNAVSAASATMTAGFNLLTIGGDGSTQNINGYIRRIRYWPRLMAAAELAQVTT
jgi:hypothetical protein